MLQNNYLHPWDDFEEIILFRTETPLDSDYYTEEDLLYPEEYSEFMEGVAWNEPEEVKWDSLGDYMTDKGISLSARYTEVDLNQADGYELGYGAGFDLESQLDELYDCIVTEK